MINEKLKTDIYLNNLAVVTGIVGDIMNTLNETEYSVSLTGDEEEAMNRARGGLSCVSDQIASLKKIMDYLETLNKI